MDLSQNNLSAKKNITAIGLMSGTSLDGLDIALCRFSGSGYRKFELIDAITVPYNNKLKNRLREAVKLSGRDLMAFHREYGEWTARQVLGFLQNKNTDIDLISSHGHTVFHEPSKKLNFQLGDGTMIAATTGITTVSDFRSLDIALGGQGAPLIPVVDRDLFGEYEACVNIGGFANVSLDVDNVRMAWDICPVNTIMNKLAEKLGLEFDKDGNAGRSGKVINKLLKQLEGLEYYRDAPPKSLGTEWLDEFVWPIIDLGKYRIVDLMATFYEHASERIAADLNRHNVKSVLFTGGGTKNSYLMTLIKNKLTGNVVIPDEMIIDFKEALGFAYLGVLRILNRPNCLASVTGAKKDNCSGIISLT